MSDNIIHLSEASSTNSYLKQLSLKEKIAEGTIVIADFQTAGRGQKGNSWISEKSKNILFSTILYPSFIKIKQQFLISQIVSLSIKNVLTGYTPDISIKWPNDIYWKNQKICGILIENELSNDHLAQSFIGIGINVNQKIFEDKSINAISLHQISGKEYDRFEILDKIKKELKRLYKESKESPETIIKEYKRNLYRLNERHCYEDKNGKFIGQIIDVELTGYLMIRTDKQEIRKYLFKEVKFI